MADDLDIRSGGAIAVDTEALRAVGVRLRAIGGRLQDAAQRVRRAQYLLVQNLSQPLLAQVMGMSGSAASLDQEAAECEDDAVGTCLMADAFELVDLQARQEMLAVRDPLAAQALQARIDALVDSDPRLEGMSAALLEEWEDGRFEGLGQQYWDMALSPVGGLLGLFGAGMLGLGITTVAKDLAGVRAGVIPPGTVLAGPKPPVSVAEVARTSPASRPHGLKGLITRIPSGSNAQVRVETYVYENGSREHFVYLDGTQSPLPGDDPWDMGSNWDGYSRENFASLEATKEALALAGVSGDEPLTVVTYSQGGLIGSYLAMDETYNVTSLVTAGSPVTPILGDDQVLVQLAHTDDPVAALAGGGSAGTSGSPDGFIATREAGEGGLFSQDSPLGPHQQDRYAETAAQADASGDVRVEGFTNGLQRLDAAVEVQSVDYEATRP